MRPKVKEPCLILQCCVQRINIFKCPCQAQRTTLTLRSIMPITRCSGQNSQSLEEFYSAWASEDNQASAAMGRSMLSVIDLVNKTFIETRIYGLTSHAHLLMLAEDDDASDRFVNIIADGSQFYIEYTIPVEKQPLEQCCRQRLNKLPAGIPGLPHYRNDRKPGLEQ